MEFILGNSTVSPLLTLITSINDIQIGPDVVALYQASTSDFPSGTTITTSNLQNAIAYSSSTSTSPLNMISILGLTTCYVDV